MGIPGQNYIVQQRGAALRNVTCEHCGTEFVYLLAREAVGQAKSVLFLDNQGAEGRATEEAELQLAKSLAEEVDPVPCPKCQLYQSSMVAAIRAGLYWWLYLVCGVCVLSAIIAFASLLSIVVYNSQDWTITHRLLLTLFGALAVLCSFGAVEVRKRWSLAFDPNGVDQQDRRLACKQKVILKEEVERDGLEPLLKPVEQANATKDHSEKLFDSVLKAVVGLFIAIVIGFLSFSMWMDFSQGILSQNWPTTNATVVSNLAKVDFERKGGAQIGWYSPGVQYKYQVAANEFTGSQYSFEPNRTTDRDAMEALMSQYPVGKTIDIYYNPTHPAVSVMVPGISGFRIVMAGFLLCLFLGSAGYTIYNLFLYFIDRRRPATPADS